MNEPITPPMEYEIVCHMHLDRLVEMVNEAIAEGWEPLGGVSGDDAGWYQAMVRRPARE